MLHDWADYPIARGECKMRERGKRELCFDLLCLTISLTIRSFAGYLSFCLVCVSKSVFIYSLQYIYLVKTVMFVLFSKLSS